MERLTPRRIRLLAAIGAQPHFAVWRGFTLRGYAPRGQPLVQLRSVRQLYVENLVDIGRVKGHPALVLTPAGRALVAARRRRPAAAAPPGELAWWQK